MGNAAPAHPQFELLKKLEGSWSGKAMHDGAAQAADATVTYRVTAHGTAVVETQFAGTPHEMVTVYHLDGQDLVLTHYCAAGNQPRMKAKPSKDASTVEFAFSGGTNLKPTVQHMHSAAIRLVDEAHLESTWVAFKGDKKLSEAKFVLERK